MSKKYAITINISESLRDAIKVAAKDDRRSVASLMEKLVFDYLKENKYLT